ncbi:two-component system sensor histidine kinase [Secundilactobacillus pentosiphilus]|uniref:histidine kinase n=1 Tax=Secundilactobacillus pentosiphilus TaxID=1714682 RepID=A0A1Z5IY11_9LACO|nr:HAMP domain-containing sensor histidine kinase [Secundilactobacillus pentosiphilus]GAX06674.1 two-component system sensor histidine kinase [Secundilactobacillus pentosiphilus]
MKLVYQQLLALLSMVAIVLVLLGLSFSRMTKQYVYQNTWTSLEKYANSLVEQSVRVSSSNPQHVNFDSESLLNSEVLLRNQSVNFTIYNRDNTAIFPDNVYISKIKTTDWQNLRQGKVVKKVTDQQAHVNSGHVEPAMTDVLKPYFYTDQKNQKHLVAVVKVGAYVSNINSNIAEINANLTKALLVASFAAMLLAFFIARYLTLRIDRLRRATNQIAKGNYDVQVPSKNRDEVDDLANDFNNMARSLQESKEEIQRQEQRRKEFMADAAHEMRTPLTTINGLLEGLAYDAIPEESKAQSIDLMRNETNRLIRLVNENLDYEKIRNNQISLNKQQFNAIDTLNRLAKQLAQKAAAKNDTISIQGGADIEVFADYDRFVQIMFNITQNAIQFTENGQIVILAQRGYQETIFKISDTGIGMTKKQLANIWDRFYKADPSRTNTKYGESGLGLAIVHQLVLLHDGKIEVTSKPNQGTTFTVIFPNQKAAKK